ncbi:membrane-associated transporter protein-like [Diadema antillarum]|uniref:membrane-associated transporter protein-like n=1 Tax=Diadema antillarum TaxID=105358 RepID=UPI003A89EC6A
MAHLSVCEPRVQPESRARRRDCACVIDLSTCSAVVTSRVVRIHSQVMHSNHGDSGSTFYSASVPTSSGRLKSYPVRIPDNSGTSPPSTETENAGIPYQVIKRRSLSISIGDSASPRHRNDSTSSIGSPVRRPSLVVRSRRSSWSISSLTVQPSRARHARRAGPPPKRSLWQLARNNAIQLGLEFCYATETAMVTPILLQLGLPTKLYGIAFFVAPIFGFLMNPLIGSTSDRCRCSWGRRRPFILALGIGTLLGVSLYLNGGDIGAAIGDKDSQDNLIGIIITLIGVVILDISADSSDGPSRSYLLDVCGLEDVNTGLNLRAILGGIGGGLGYITNGIDWTSTVLVKAFGSQLRVVFFFNVVIYTICLILNLTSIPETPLGGNERNDDAEKLVVSTDRQNNHRDDEDVIDENAPLIVKNSHPKRDRRKVSESRRDTRNYQTSSIESRSTIPSELGSSPGMTSPRRSVGNGSLNELNLTSDLPLISGEHSEEDDDGEEPTSVLALLKSILHMPKELRRLCVNHYFGWAGMVTVLLFFTDFVGQAVYDGDPTAPEGSTAYEAYHAGVKMGCWGMAVFAFSSSLSAIFYMKVDTILSHRTLYVFGQLSFAVGNGLMAVFVDHAYAVLILCFTFGIQFTTLFTVPFNILASFHDCDSYKNPKGGVRRGLGTDVACLCCQLFLAQITVSSVMGPLVSAIGSQITVVIFASVMGFLAALSSAVLVIYKDKPINLVIYRQ